MCGLGFGVGVPSGLLWSKNSNCSGLTAVACVGLTCTQYSRQLRVCPRASSAQPEPGVANGKVAMARRTVSAVGPSLSVQLSDRYVIHGGFHPHEVATRLSSVSAAIDRRTRQA